MISAVSELYNLHPQTLRLYERVGLLKPSRSEGNTRLYTDADLERLEVILTLTRDMGVNLAGIEIILNMREKMGEMQRQMKAFAEFVQQELSHGLHSAPAQAFARCHGSCSTFASDPRSQIAFRSFFDSGRFVFHISDFFHGRDPLRARLRSAYALESWLNRNVLCAAELAGDWSSG